MPGCLVQRSDQLIHLYHVWEEAAMVWQVMKGWVGLEAMGKGKVEVQVEGAVVGVELMEAKEGEKGALLLDKEEEKAEAQGGEEEVEGEEVLGEVAKAGGKSTGRCHFPHST